MAINREPMTLLEFKEDLLTQKSSGELLGALRALQRRSLIEKTSMQFTQQPVVKVLRGHLGVIWSMAFGCNGNILASCSLDKTVRLWDVRDGSCLKILHGHVDQVTAVSFSPQGNVLASSSLDHTIKLWNVETGEVLKTLASSAGRLWSVAWNPNGKTLASGSENSEIRLWDVSTGECLKNWRGHSRRIYAVAFSPVSAASPEGIGATVASSSEDETVKLWNLTTGDCLKTLHTQRLYEAMNITGAMGLTQAQTVTLKALGAVGDIIQM
ncbi:MAG: WD40 repeat domain-containing protein [Scytonema sp. CRU_2_7]|nr:WD40 repeat domain-containing protein [Scytonema sp. CRU_2_7]